MTTESLADFANAQKLTADAIARACVDLVDYEAGDLGQSGMYAALVGAARSAADVDQMLYQLAGDRAYAEQAALLVLSAAWNRPEAVAPLQRILIAAAAGSEVVDDNRLATSALYGMYVLARAGKEPLHEVTFRNAAGAFEAQPVDGALTAAALFDSVRSLY